MKGRKKVVLNGSVAAGEDLLHDGRCYRVGEAAQLSGVSVRTLHYYDEIGLLSPSSAEENGYRCYHEDDLERLQQILFYRELDFPLNEIKDLLLLPHYDRREATKHHRELLVLKRRRLDGLISLLDETLKGAPVAFSEFDMTPIEEAKQAYTQEVRARWGTSDAYRESEGKVAQYTQKDWESITGQSQAIFSAFAALAAQEVDPAQSEVQALVVRWKDHITEHYYACTDEILSGLGEMYVCDTRFKETIDASGEGTAQFMSAAIAVYCGDGSA